MKKALVFGSGGAKGSYEIGVWKATRKLHMHFDIVTGVSIGSINAAFYAMKKYNLAKNMWLNIKTSDLFDLEIGGKLSADDYKDIVKEMIKKGGMSFSRAEKFLRKYIDETKVRQSSIDYGLITVSLITKKPRILSKENIPVGKLVDYISASSTCFPFVAKKEIDGDYYIDGGYYDGIPINLAIEMGAKEILAVDLSTFSSVKKVKDPNVKIDIIKFKDNTKFTLEFTKELAKKNIRYGYNDTLKYFNKLDGDKYTFKKNNLLKNYKNISKKFINLIIEILFINKENANKIYGLFDIAKLNKLLNKIKNKEDVSKEMNEAIEYLGEIFEVRDDYIYEINYFNKILTKKVNELNYIKLNKNLKGKFLVSYIFNNYEKNSSNKKLTKELYNIALIFPKDFLAAMYLIVISDKYKLFSKTDNKYEDVFNKIKE